MTMAIETTKEAKLKPSVLMSVYRGLRTTAILIVCFWLLLVLYFTPDSLWMQLQAHVRRGAILAEIEKAGPQIWAGEYSPIGRWLGSHNLLLAPHAGYLYEEYACMGLCDRRYGTAKEENGRIRLSFWSSAPHGLSQELVPVTWGERHYLIPVGELKEFCARADVSENADDPPLWRYLLRVEDRKKPATGQPRLPKEFQSYLRTGSVRAEIMAVNETQAIPAMGDMSLKRTVISLRGGRFQGIRRGMTLHVTTPEQFSGIVKVQYVFDETAGGLVLWNDRHFAAPEVGWKLSSESRASKN